MPNQEVNLTKRVQTERGLRYCPVVLAANGRVKPEWVLVNGKEERHAEGSYYVEWYEGSKRIRVSVGKDAAVANARRLRKEAELQAVNNGVAVIAEDTRNGKHQPIADAIADYLSEIKISRSAATHSAYALALRNFTESCEKQYLEQIDRLDLLEYVRYMREELGLVDRTCHNRFEHVLNISESERNRESGDQA